MFHCYDAESIVQRNRACKHDTENILFSVDRLPGVATDRSFDLVYCYATLHYVRDSKRAIQNLYDCVVGHLVFNYPNRRSQAAMESEFGADHPFRDRFALVYNGESLLSDNRIRDVLGTEPRSYWSAVNAPDEEWTGPQNPCVYVRK